MSASGEGTRIEVETCRKQFYLRSRDACAYLVVARDSPTHSSPEFGVAEDRRESGEMSC